MFIRHFSSSVSSDFGAKSTSPQEVGTTVSSFNCLCTDSFSSLRISEDDQEAALISSLVSAVSGLTHVSAASSELTVFLTRISSTHFFSSSGFTSGAKFTDPVLLTSARTEPICSTLT
ncbi:hypothetical protein HanRHA438_Chr17g0808671 [Helianthus annuus]|nr:hypothetical protein HanRHA438_Chr17g0808671 [Helianthus annuus]